MSSVSDRRVGGHEISMFKVKETFFSLLQHAVI